MSRLNIGDKGHKVRKPGDVRPWPEETNWLDLPTEHDHHAREKGLRDGDKGIINSEVLASQYRRAYIRGWRNGTWWRYARERRFGKTKYELFELLYMPRYPHAPPLLLA